MEKIDYDILKAKILINDIYQYELNLENYRIFEQIYSFTTENIKGYYNLIDFKDKDVLTVGSSGDHTLNLYLKNVKSVDFFDINSFSKYYFDLKKAAIQSLEKEEFLNYFCLINYPKYFETNKEAFNIKLYQKILPYLNKNSKYFWDNLYLENSGFEIRSSNLFSKDEERYGVLEKSNIYLDDTSYYDLKNNITNYEEPYFYNSDIKTLIPNKKYDIIMLSNIPRYLEYMFKEKHLQNFKVIIDNLYNYLNDNGIIMLSYLYDVNHYQYLINCPSIYNFEELDKLFDNVKMLKFKGINNISHHYQMISKDAVLIYKKTK